MNKNDQFQVQTYTSSEVVTKVVLDIQVLSAAPPGIPDCNTPRTGFPN